MTTGSAPTAGTITVRDAHPEDEAPLRAVAARAFDRFDMLLYSTRDRDVLVAVDDQDRPVGGVVIDATPVAGEPAPHGRVGVVHFVFVDPEVDARGIGGALRDAADARFDELGCTEVAARIDATNSASQALHRAGGFRPATFGQQLRRWGWRLPLRWQQVGHGFDPGMQLWLRPAPEPDTPTRTARALASTLGLNLLLLALVAWRSPRGEAGAVPTLLAILVTASLLLGVRETAVRTVARAAGARLRHHPWHNGLGLAGLLALAVGVWFPLTGSSTPQRTGWRLDREVALLGRAHLAGGLAVAALAWLAVLAAPTGLEAVWPEVRRAALTLALVDLVVPVSPMIGNAARHVRRWSVVAWAGLALLAVGAQLTALAAT